MDNNEIFAKLKKQIAVHNFEQEYNSSIYPLQKEWRSYELKKTFLHIIAAIFAVFACGITVYAGVNGGLNIKNIGLLKASESYEENKIDINKTIENDYVKVILEEIACDSAYLIIQYDIIPKEKAITEMGEIEYSSRFGYKIGLNTRIWINDEESNQISEKIEKVSENEYKFLQVVNLMEMDEENIHVKIWLDNFNIGKYYNIRNGIKLNKMIEMDVTIEEENTIVNNVQQIDENTKIVLEKISNSNLETFIRLSRITENILWKDYNQIEHYGFNASSPENDALQCNCYDFPVRVYRINEDGETRIDNWLRLNEDDLVRIEKTYAIILGTQTDYDTINIFHTKSTFYSDRTNEEKDAYYAAEWYPVKEGKVEYTGTNSKGGSITINKIEVDDNFITFYYDTKGILSNKSSYIKLRANNGMMNIIYPINVEKKNVDGDENKITFSRDTFGISGLNIREGMLKDISKIEFTLLMGDVEEIVGDEFIVDIPNQKNSKSKINNMKINDTNVLTYTYELPTRIYDLVDGETTINETRYVELDSYNNELLNYGRNGINMYNNQFRELKKGENINELKQELENHFNENSIKYEVKEMQNGDLSHIIE